uniref:Uncharacterized protein n=1 Tax=Sphaerodactylus townsendi TaxID=933632 RepID=A0ACB8G429_9SAUR
MGQRPSAETRHLLAPAAPGQGRVLRRLYAARDGSDPGEEGPCDGDAASLPSTIGSGELGLGGNRFIFTTAGTVVAFPDRVCLCKIGTRNLLNGMAWFREREVL